MKNSEAGIWKQIYQYKVQEFPQDHSHFCHQLQI